MVERADGALDGFDLVQAYDREGLPAQAILASRGDPPAQPPEGMPLLLDLPFGSRPGPADLREHWRRAAGVRAPVVLAGSLTPDNVGEAVQGRPALGGRHRARRGDRARGQGRGADRAVRGGRAGGIVSGAGLPDERGRFGEFGGRFVPETVMGALDELAAGYAAAQADPSFAAELEQLARDYVGRPSPLYLAERLSEQTGARIYLKREDLEPHRRPQDQ